MRRKCLFIIVLLCQLTITARVLAQSAVRTSVGGLNKTNLMTKDEIDVKGSRYLTVGWAKGMVKMASGQIHKDMDLRYNQLDDELTFKNTDGSELSFQEPVAEFNITTVADDKKTTRLFRNNFVPIKGTTNLAFYEILYDGKIKLVKKNFKYIESYQPYITEAVVKTVMDKNKYYAVIDNKLTEFKNNKKSLEVFGSKADKIQEYISTNKLDLKLEADLIKVFAYNDAI
jgi:hypothetical protein